MDSAPTAPADGGRLVLGTAQLGMDYGVTNRNRKPNKATAMSLLEVASEQGITDLDTARLYGDSEELIGEYRSACSRPFPFRVLTKLDPMEALPAEDEVLQGATLTSIEQSMRALRTDFIECVMLHRPAQRTLAGGVAWRTLVRERDQGRIGCLGVSVSSPDELLDCLADPDVAHVQFPFNCLDHRFEHPRLVHALQMRKDVVVHVRSALLQGLIASADEQQLRSMFGEVGAEIWSFLCKLTDLAGEPSRLRAAIAYVRAMPWIDGIVIGTSSPHELKELAKAFEGPPRHALVSEIRVARPHLPEEVLNPARWPKNITTNS